MLRLLAVFLLAWPLFGQNASHLSWPAEKISSLQLILPYANQVEIIGEVRATIEIRYITEGEYQNELRLSPTPIGNELHIEEQLSPSFDPFHDKLSAHKVMASTLQIKLPTTKTLSLQIQQAKSTIQGKIKKLVLKQNEGNVAILSAGIKGTILTNKAPIVLHNGNQNVFAVSKKGEVQGRFSSKAEADLILESNSGNISHASNRK